MGSLPIPDLPTSLPSLFPDKEGGLEDLAFDAGMYRDGPHTPDFKVSCKLEEDAVQRRHGVRGVHQFGSVAPTELHNPTGACTSSHVHSAQYKPTRIMPL